MTPLPIKPSSPADLRERAQSRLVRPVGLDGTYASATAAMRVLHDLASSSETAVDALALLHELQVHQVELDLQAEELRNASAELEAALARQFQLFHSAPVAYLVVDAQTLVLDCNETALQQLGETRDSLPGKRLDRFVTSSSRSTLHGLLASVIQQNTRRCASLDLAGQDGSSHRLVASASIDPSGTGCLLVLSPMPDV